MLYLRKKEIKDGIVYYYYQPEGKGEWGLVYFVIDSGKFGYEYLSENDEAVWYYYRFHAYSRIKKYVKENNFPEKDLVAWG